MNISGSNHIWIAPGFFITLCVFSTLEKLTTIFITLIAMKKQIYKEPRFEIEETLYDSLLCSSPGTGENEGTGEEPLD